MKRLMWGAFLFFATAGSLTTLDACDWKTMFMDPQQHATVYRDGRNTIMITSDDEFITIVTYTASDHDSAEWM